MKEITAFMYIIVNKNNQGQIGTLRDYRKDCIADFIKGWTPGWKEAKKYGWKCKKVEVNIKTLSNNEQEEQK